jgi:hypothetical protein
LQYKRFPEKTNTVSNECGQCLVSVS